MNALCVSSTSSISLEKTKELLEEATARRIKDIVRISNESIRNHSPRGIRYPGNISLDSPVYQQLLNSGMLASGYVPDQFFDPYKIPTWPGRLPLHFIAKENVLPSDAVEAAIRGPSIADCGMACQLARYGALLDVLRKDKFNKLFSTPNNRANTEHCMDLDQPMRFFIRFTNENSGGKNDRPITAGELVSFEGVPDYTKKHPYGECGGINCICVDATKGSQKFVGLGLREEGVTEDEIEKFLINEYNKPNDDAFFRFPKQFHAELAGRHAQLTAFKTDQAASVIGYKPDCTQGYRLEFIQSLINRDISELNSPLDIIYIQPKTVGSPVANSR